MKTRCWMIVVLGFAIPSGCKHKTHDGTLDAGQLDSGTDSWVTDGAQLDTGPASDAGGPAGTVYDLPFDRRTLWDPGAQGGIPQCSGTVRDVTQPPYNAAGDGSADDTAAIQAALDDSVFCDIVYLPAGTYRTTAQLDIDTGLVLRGAGPGQTTIELDTADEHDVIEVGGDTSMEAPITVGSGFSKGSTQLTLVDAASISVDDFIVVQQENESGLVFPDGYLGTCTWCGVAQEENKAMGQIVQVTAKSGETITISRPLFYEFSVGLNPEVRRISFMLSGVGIEEITLQRAQTGGSYSERNIVYFKGVVDSWVRNVVFADTVGAHIRIRQGFRISILDSMFDSSDTSFSHGSGRNYGIMLWTENSDILIQNNVFEMCRHSVAFEGGGSGCVVAYNYTHDSGFDTDAEEFLSGDMLTHGVHPYMNLYEGNHVGNFRFDNVWGSSSHNTVFRNVSLMTRECATLSGQDGFDFAEHNYYHNTVGNVIGRIGMQGSVGPATECDTEDWVYRFGCRHPGRGTEEIADPNVAATVLVHGDYNHVTGEVIWNGDDERALPASLFLDGPPEFFHPCDAWPPIGPDVAGYVSPGFIPAYRRYHGLPDPVCP